MSRRCRRANRKDMLGQLLGLDVPETPQDPAQAADALAQFGDRQVGPAVGVVGQVT